MSADAPGADASVSASPVKAATAAAAAAGDIGDAGTGVGAALFKAAAAGDTGTLSTLLARATDADLMWAAAPEGQTALMAAAENGHAGAVLALLQAGAPWNQLDADGYCAGEYATASKRRDIVELLLEWGVQSELAMMQAEDRDGGARASTSATASENAEYLQQQLHYTPEGDKLLDANGEAVMMGWEAPLMHRHAAAICGAGGGHYLNVGFGLGIVDSAIQGHSPASHTIIEAHPDVHAHMLACGWDKKPGVHILFGRWQDVLPQLQPGHYDGIFFDTYGEYYAEVGQPGIRAFHQHLPQLLSPTGVYSYFNGFASDSLFFHMVYGRLVQVELARLGLRTSFQQLRVAELGDEVWQGVRNAYWRFPQYFLPLVVRDAPAPADEGVPVDGDGSQQAQGL